MNHFHRVIFNPSLGVRQVVSEIASSGRGTGSQASTDSTSRTSGGGTGSTSATQTAASRRFKANAGMAFLLALGMTSAAQGQAFGGDGGVGGFTTGSRGATGGTTVLPDGSTGSSRGSAGAGGGGGGSNLTAGLNAGNGGNGGAGGNSPAIGEGTGGPGGLGGGVGSKTASINTDVLKGGAGNIGVSGTPGFSSAGGSGGGGGGGFGLVLDDGGTASNSGQTIGGAGGAGGAGTITSAGTSGYSGAGGGGGSGGGGVLLTGRANFTNNESGTIEGGRGGNGGAAAEISKEGASGNGSGGDGGIGVALTGGGNVTNSGRISAGAGGSNGPIFSNFYSTSDASHGGTAVLVTAGGMVVNNGLLEGGAGAAGGAGIAATGNTSVTNAGTITGGLNGDGVTRANAIDFSGGNNTLTLQAGYAFNGNVVSTSGATLGGDTLALGGDVTPSAAFDVGSLSASYAGTQYLGFSNFVKSGASTWVLTGSGNAGQNWSIVSGTLQGDANTFKGNISFAPPAGGNASVVFSQSAVSGAYKGIISGAGSVAKIGDATLTLTGDNNYFGGTTISAGTLQIGDGGNNTGGTLGSGAVTINNNAALVFKRLGTLTAANDIGGDGSLSQTGGTLVLSGTSDYTGGTTISAGSTLQLGNGGDKGSITGDVQNEGTLAFHRNDNALDFSGAISGNGNVHQIGPGTVILSGDNDYKGGTTISAGSTLQLGNGGNSGSITGDVTNDGTLAFNRSASAPPLNFSGLISGNGNVRQSGAGIVILSGVNTYTGGTLLDAGTLSVADDRYLGKDFGSLSFNGGALRTTDSFAMSRATTLGALGGTIDTATDKTLTQQGLISDAAGQTGSLTKNGDGTLVLSGNNSYSGGTTLNAGVLSVEADSNLGSATGALTFNGGALQTTAGFAMNRATTLGALGGTIDTAARTTLTQQGVIGDATGVEGSLTKTGDGTLILSGNNTYTGSTTISAGTLQIGEGDGTGSLGAGAVTNNAALVFNRSGTLTTANISGTGTLDKQGTGNLILTGANTYTGATTVSAGTLSVNGSITSATTVNSGGTLGGNGNVGHVTIAGGGTLAPGNSIGTLTVNGNLTFASGSVYRVETDASGNADRVYVVNVAGVPGTGTVTITGGTVNVQAGEGNYARNTSYTILSSQGATTGTFSGVTSNLAFLTPSLSYLSNSVTLNLQSENAPAYNTVAQTPNQVSIANYLNSFANTPGNAAAAALIQQIDNLTAEQARTAFDSMSGSQHAAASQIAGALGRNFSATLAARTGFGLGSAGTSVSSTAGLKAIRFAAVSPALLTRPGDVVSDSPLRVSAADSSSASQDRPALQSVGGLWGQATGTGGRTGSDGNGAASRYRASGFVFGYDQPISSNWLAGAALAYNKAQWDASTNGAAPASGRITTPQAGLYARYTDGPWQVRLDGSYSDHRFSTDRTVTISNASSTARSSHGGTEWAFAAQAEYAINHGEWEVRPLAGLRHARLSEDGFTETGAGAATLTVDARRSQNTVASLGMKFIRPLNPSNTDTGSLELRAIASHLMGDNDSPLSSRLAGQAARFAATGTPLKRTALTLGGTLTGQLSRGLSAYTDAAYEYRGAGQNAFQLTAGLKLAW